MLVRIEMRRPDALASDAIDLRGQLSLDLLERHSASQAGDDERFPRSAKPSIVFDQAGHAVGREHRRAIDESEMDADAVSEGRAQDAANGLGRRRRVGEQTGAGDDAPVMGIEDARVHAGGQPKIVGVDDEMSKHGYLPGIRNT